ncbi:peroxidasin homolog [Paramuricea clavata]|uniref:Peroxidasin homolog n=1 Tax=Paramuricea clavata TaxID=317549 RepID=A0A6S7FQJ9_PARCT|nr:peroxidasin homolog [Paramuricea clavata]
MNSANMQLICRVKPTVTLSCSSSIIENEGDDFTCVCRGEGGNPPANVIWFKDGVQIGATGKEEQTLTVSNVDGTDSGQYKCMAQSHINATDEKSIEVKVRLNFKPNKTIITLPDTAVVGKKVIITCESDGLPEPSYTIIHNGTEVSSKKTHTISEVKRSDAGLYQCVAANKLGSNSKSHCLAVVGEPAACKKLDCESSAETVVVVWHIVVTLVSGIIIGILFSYIVWSSHRRWFRSRKPERNPETNTTAADTTYQELNLTQMNKEDNYQSLRLNIASNDEESTYTELNKTRDEENY